MCRFTSFGSGFLFSTWVFDSSSDPVGHYFPFIMVTLAFAQMTYFIIHDTPVGGGMEAR